MGHAIERWQGGRLRLYMPIPPTVSGAGTRIERLPIDDEYDFAPLGDGWAIRADLPLGVTLADDQPKAVRGLRVRLDMRDGRFQCVAVESGDEGPALTTSVLRALGPLVARLARERWPTVVVRLVELDDGTIIGEQPWAIPTTERGVLYGDPRRPSFGEPAQDVLDEHKRRTRRPGRQPLPDELLAEVAAAYREAERIGRPHIERLRERFPGHSAPTLRNWTRKARERGFLGPAPSPRMAGELRRESAT
jgi:hypothetical protein